MIYDCSDIGIDSFNIDIFKQMVHMGDINIERLHRIYLYNVGWGMKAILAISRPFTPEKTREKIRYGDESILLDDIDRSQLPPELGGTANYSLEEAFNLRPV